MKFVYDDIPLPDVLTSIEKAYNIEIIIENEFNNNCSVSGDLTKKNFYDKLEFICQAFRLPMK